MSKSAPKNDKKTVLAVQTRERALQKVAAPLPAMRDVTVPAVHADTHNVIVAYKDLNQPLKELAYAQNRNLFFGFVVFLILGLGILMGTHFSKKPAVRGTASPELSQLVPAGADTISESYHFDKSCYRSENGEEVCVQRTSRKSR